MSLIHQALKKVENSRGGYSTPATTARLSSANRGLRRYVIASIALAVLLLAAFSFYWARSRQADSVAFKKTGAGSVNGAKTGRTIPVDAPGEDRGVKGISLYRMAKYAEAEAVFREAVKAAPQDAVNWNNLGLTLMVLGKYDEAEAAFKKALELKPGYPQALNNYGALLDRKGDMNGAVKLLEKALALNPDYPEAHLNLAISSEKLGDYKKAVDHYRAYLDRNPGAQSVEKRISRLRPALRTPRKDGAI